MKRTQHIRVFLSCSILATSFLFASNADGGSQTYMPPMVQARAEIKWVRPICVQTNRYIGWPSVCRLKNGDIIAVFSGDRKSHICPFGKVQMVRSSDDGETWSKPVTIADGPIDDRDAGIVQLPDGEIVVTYFTSIAYRNRAKIYAANPEYREHDMGVTDETREKSLGYFRIGSRDNGRTWSRPHLMKNVSHAPHGPILLKDGSLLMLGRGYEGGKNGAGRSIRGLQTVISAWRSTDAAHTWTCLCPEIPAADGEHLKKDMFHEPHVVELSDGTLLGMIRYHGKKRYMYRTRSRDGGRTWSPMERTSVYGYPAHLLPLENSGALCVYGRRHGESLGEFAVVTRDGGETWDTDNEMCLRTKPRDYYASLADIGYPSSVFLPSGEILTVYYEPCSPRKKPVLMATKWRFGDIGRLQAGFGRIDITPPLGIKLSGYFRVRIADGVLDPLEANAVAFSDGVRKAVLVSIDSISLRSYFDLFRRRISEATGLPADAVFLTTTHIHTGPLLIRRGGKAYGESSDDFSDANEYCRSLCDKVVSVSKTALDDLAPAKFSCARSSAPGISFVRRYLMKDGSVRTAPKIGSPDIVAPAGKADDSVQVVRIDRKGRDSIALVNFQCHPDTIGGTKISADWPGVVRRSVEGAMDGVRCVFLNGAEGDTNHHMCKDMGFPRPSDRILMHKYMGRRIAGAVLGVWDVCKPLESGEISFLVKKTRTASNRPDPKDMPEARRITRLYSENPRSREIPGKGMERNANIADARRKVRLENGPDFFEPPLSMLSIGKDLAFVGFPGEPFTDYGRKVKERSPFAMTVPMCLTNGNFGYLPTDEALEDLAGYEARGSIFRHGLEKTMVDAAVKGLHELKFSCE